MDHNGNGRVDEQLSALGRALGCDIRLAVLLALASGDAPVGELVGRTGTTQPNMSNHLAVLRTAGLVTDRRLGRTIRYELATPEVVELVRALAALAGSARTAL